MIEAKLKSLRDVKPHDYVIRFLFGGLCTLLAGLIAKHSGPEIGGLFLAFPAIFPAGASLLERHERDKKQKAGLDGKIRGSVVAGVDAIGASAGCVGGVSIIIWRLMKGRAFRLRFCHRKFHSPFER